MARGSKPGNDAYGTARKLDNALRRLAANHRLAKGAKATLHRFVEDLAARGLSLHRQLWYLTHLVPVAESLGSAFLRPSKDDVKAYVASVERSALSDWSKANKRTAVKRFYKWLLADDEEYPEAVRWIRTTAGTGHRVLPENLPTKDEVDRLLRAAVNPRDRALIAVLADGGLRIGEALVLRRKDFHPDAYGGYLTVPAGKTGARRVRLVDAVPHVTAWLRAHPFREEDDAPLFCYLSDQRAATRTKGKDGPEERLTGHERGEPLTYPAARAAIRKAAKRAGVSEAKVNPHAFRHYRATRLARDVPEAPLEAHMGWVPGSKMSEVYVHLSGRDTDAAILRAHGIDVRGDETAEAEVPIRCPRCETWNEADARFCQGCGMALTVEAAEAVDETTDFLGRLLLRVAEDPRLARRLRDALEG
ncbi:MAG: tyrosine-type recombinase/integrase [bacterium]